VYPGGGNYQGLLKAVPMDAEADALEAEIPGWLAGARATLRGDEPAIEPGGQCSEPWECPFIAHCTAGMATTEFPLSDIPNLRGKRLEGLEEMGICDVREIPDDYELTENQQWVWQVIRGGKPELLPDAGREIAALPMPRYYMDFETVSMAVPVWAGSRPYQKIPVQWSVHVESAPGRIRHLAHLADGRGDPRRAFAESLLAAVGTDGPVFVYHASFEIGRLRELGEDLPDLAAGIHALVDRIVDLKPLAKGSYCHPDMHGSWSLKAVLPTIAPELDYASMEVGDGGAAEGAWLEILHPDTPDGRRQSLRKALAEYCLVDTLALVRLAEFLQSAAD
jgi:hypothetical protein